MDLFNKILLILHFVGLTLGFSVSISNAVMLGIITKAATGERSVLARFPPVMSKVGRVGLLLLWLTGLIMVYTRWNGFDGMPWQFHVKITAVVLLTITVLFIGKLEGQISRGDTAAAATLPTFGKAAALFGLTALVFAVLTFN
ncbi:MAG: hypothetical protein ABL982_15925 [Vicinamibacterales bacterium]